MRERASGEIWMIVGIVLLIVVGTPIGWYVKFHTADIRGKIDANEKIKANGDFRIQAYDSFFEQCASVQNNEVALHAQQAELKTAKDQRRIGQIQTNIAALTSARGDAVNGYNADARKSYTAGQFRSSDLPYQLPIQAPSEGTTSCEN